MFIKVTCYNMQAIRREVKMAGVVGELDLVKFLRSLHLDLARVTCWQNRAVDDAGLAGNVAGWECW